jgi:hypothetical protein
LLDESNVRLIYDRPTIKSQEVFEKKKNNLCNRTNKNTKQKRHGFSHVKNVRKEKLLNLIYRITFKHGMNNIAEFTGNRTDGS